MTWTHQIKRSKFNRRFAISSLTSFLGTSLFPFSKLKADSNAVPAKRLAIVGGGMGGIATAYFSGAEWNIDLFESEARIGGHADTRSFDVDGTQYSMDVGAEFFHPDTHPLYWTLLTHIGAHTPKNKKNDLVIT